MEIGYAFFIFRYWGACSYRHPFIFAQPFKGAIACFSLKSRCNRSNNVVYAEEDADMSYGDWFCLACGIYFYAKNLRAK